MKIYIVHGEALHESKPFKDYTNEEIEQMRKENSYISRYDSLEELERDWNDDYIFSPTESYMRIVND